MAATRRSILTGCVGPLGLAIFGIRLSQPPTSTSGIVVTEDSWVLRKSDLDLLQ